MSQDVPNINLRTIRSAAGMRRQGLCTVCGKKEAQESMIEAEYGILVKNEDIIRRDRMKIIRKAKEAPQNYVREIKKCIS